MATRHVRAHLKESSGGQSKEMFFKTSDNDVVITSTNSKLPQDITSLRNLVDVLGELAFADDIELDVASTSQYGVTKLSNTINDTTSEGFAATTKAVSDVNAAAVHNTGNETIAGTKTFSSGSVIIGDMELVYDANKNSLDIQAVSN